ncbi:MAG TPA: M56 family metallopeptidase [Vicinamibacterales bacterium]|nr:M56 family metallopeptidase [Vicinamibacterales bacterium]
MNGSFVVSMLAGVTFVTAGSLAAVRFARTGRAATRHVWLASSFVTLLLLPAVAIVAPRMELAVPAVARSSVVAPAVELINEVVSATPPVTAPQTRASETTRAVHMPPWPAVLVVAWLAGACLCLAPVIIGLSQIRPLRRSGVPWAHGNAVAGQLAVKLQLRSRVDVLLHERAAGPMTCGMMHATIVLPIDAESWSSGTLERSLVHELEHVRRRDWASHCLARMICAAYWFHPLVWVTWRQLTLEAERACDDAVVLRTEAVVYAQQLVEFAKRLSTAPQPLLGMANRRDLAIRIRALLDRKQARGRAGAIAVGLAALVSAALVLTISPLRVVAADQAATNPAFDVASVRLHVGGIDRNTLVPPTALPGGRFVSRFPLPLLISWAYKLPTNQNGLKGVPDWAQGTGAIYDVEAIAAMPPGLSVQARDDRVRAMVQALLIDRFKLVIRRESKEMPVYALVAAKGGPKLQPADINEQDCPEASLSALGPQTASTAMPDVCHAFTGGMGRGLHARAATLSDLAAFVESWTDRPILDKTGIQGLYRFETKPWLPMDAMSDPSGPQADKQTVFQMFETLGLRLEGQKGVADVYLVQHLEKPSPDGPVSEAMNARR